MQEIKVTEDEMKALAQFADSEGQVSKTKPDLKNFTTTQSWQCLSSNTMKFSF